MKKKNIIAQIDRKQIQVDLVEFNDLLWIVRVCFSLSFFFIEKVWIVNGCTNSDIASYSCIAFDRSEIFVVVVICIDEIGQTMNEHKTT